MSYQALYRKFRPDNFEDVKGQDHIVKKKKNPIISVMRIFLAGHAEPEKRPWLKSLPKQ